MIFFRDNLKKLAGFNVFIQILYPILLAFTPAVLANAQKEQQQQPLSKWETTTTEPSYFDEKNLATYSKEFGQLLSDSPTKDKVGDKARGLVNSQLSSAATDEIKNWLSGHNNVAIQLNVDDEFSLKNSQIDALLSWYDSENSLFFSQHSFHRTDDRNQLNTGLGYRYFNENSMIGSNVFYDYDLTRKHSRLGVGVEYWRDYLKLASNGYIRLSDWKDAPELNSDYYARPANGWDVRSEFYIPDYPQIGVKTVFEQYYGDEVALFGKDDRQKDPYALTLGLNYTPVPLVTFNLDRKQGKANKNDTSLGVALSYQFGQLLDKQLDPNELAFKRSLMGSRYDFVDRNNNIILEYKKKDLIQLKLSPEKLTGESEAVFNVTANVNSKYHLDRIEWNKGNADVSIKETSKTDFVITIPKYLQNELNSYTISATAFDTEGNSAADKLQITVEKASLSKDDSYYTNDKNEKINSLKLPADGVSKQKVFIHFVDDANNPVDIQKNQFTVSFVNNSRNLNSQLKIDEANKEKTGVYSFYVYPGTQIEKGLIKTVVESETFLVMDVSTYGDDQTATLPPDGALTLEKKTPQVINNKNAVTAHIIDEHGNPVANYSVTFNVTNTAGNLDGFSFVGGTNTVKTQQDGSARLEFTSKKADVYTIGIDINGATRNVNASFIPDMKSIYIKELSLLEKLPIEVKQPNAVTALITDNEGNPIENIVVNFDTDNKTGIEIIGSNNITTNSKGEATLDFTSTQARTGIIVASIDSAPSKSIDATFKASYATLQGVMTLRMATPVTVGQGNAITVRLSDQFNNPIENYPFTIDVISGDTSQFTFNNGNNAVTDMQGKATIEFNSDIADKFTFELKDITASPVTAQFIADFSHAYVQSLKVTKPQLIVGEEGEAIAVVVDNKNNLVNKAVVSFSADSITGINFNHNITDIETDENGKAVIKFTSTNAMTGFIYANVGTTDTKEAQVTFKAQQSNLKGSLELSNQTAVTVGEYNEATIRITDTFGNPIINKAAKLKASSVNGSIADNVKFIDNDSTVTDENGQANIRFTSQFTGQYDISIDDTAITAQSERAIFDADINNIELKELTLENQGDVVVNTDNIATALVLDKFGNKVKNAQVTFFQDTNRSLIFVGRTTVTTDNEGKASVKFTSQKAGTFVVSASVGLGVAKTVDAKFVADTSEITGLLILDDTDAVFVNKPNTVTIKLTDKFGNSIAGRLVEVSATNTDNYPLDYTVSNKETTDALGIAQIEFTSKKAGSYSLGLIDNEITANSVHAKFIADTNSAKIIQLLILDSSGHSVADNTALTVGQEYAVKAIVEDEDSNRVENTTVVFDSDTMQSFKFIGNTHVVTNNQGEAAIKFNNNKVEYGDIVAQVSSSSASDSIGIGFKANIDNIIATLTLLTPEPKEVMAGERNSAQIVLTDNFSNPIVSHAITLVANGENTNKFSFDNNSQQTDANGKAIITFTSELIGTYNIKFDEYNKPSANAIFIANSNSNKTKIAQLDIEHPTAVIQTPNSATATVTDIYGNIITGALVTFSADKLDGIVYDGIRQIATDAQGKAKLQFTATKARKGTITAVTGNSTPEIKDVEFTANTNEIMANLTLKYGQPIAVGTNNIVTIELTDKFNNPIENKEVSIESVNADDLNFTDSNKATTNENGIATIEFSSNLSGSYILNLSSDPQIIEANKVEAIFSADTSSAQVTDLKLNESSLKVNTQNKATATVTDKNGNSVGAGIKVIFTADASGKIIFEQSSNSITDDNGIATINFSSQLATTSNIYAFIENSTDIAQQPVTFTADEDSIKGTLTVDRNNMIAGEDNTVIVSLMDQYNNPITDKNFTLQSKNKSGQSGNIIFVKSNQSTVSEQTDHQGKSTLSFRGENIGSYEINLDNIVANTVTVDVAANISAVKIKSLDVIDGDKSDLTVAKSYTTKAVIVDNYDNIVTNQTVTFSSNSGISFEQSRYVVSNAAGEALLKFNSKTALTDTITASIGQSTESISVIFKADATQLKGVLSLDDLNAVVVGKNNAVTTLITDIYNNPIANKEVTFTVSSENGDVSKFKFENGETKAVTDGTGHTKLVFTSESKGNFTIGIKDIDANKVNAQFSSDVNSAVIEKLTLEYPHLTVEQWNTATTEVKDKFGNAVVGAVVTFNTTNSSGIKYKNNINEVQTDNNGNAVIDFTSEQAREVTMNATINSSKKSEKTRFDADKLSMTGVLVLRNSADVVVGNNNMVTATLKDKYQNPIVGQQVTLIAEGSNSADLQFKEGNNSLETDDKGQVVFTFSSEKTGKYALKLLDIQSNTVTASFIADIASAKIVKLDLLKEKLLVGEYNTATAYVSDKFGNIVENASVLFNSKDTTGVIFTGDRNVLTNEKGEASFTFTSTIAREGDISATINISSATRTMQFEANMAQAKGQLTLQNTSVVTVGKNNKVNVKIVDNYGNAIPAFNFKLNVSGADISKFKFEDNKDSATTNAQGLAALSFSSELSGDYIIALDIIEGNNVTARFSADMSTAKVVQLTLADDNLVIGQKNTVTAIVKDKFGNLVNLAEVLFYADSDMGIVFKNDNSVTTNKDGQASMEFTGNIARTSTIKSQVGSSTEASIDTTFKADAKSADINLVWENSNNMTLSDNKDTNKVRVTLTDDKGNRVPDALITYSLSGINQKEARTENNGEVLLELTSSVFGSLDLVVKSKDSNKEKLIKINFYPDVMNVKIITQ